jgi:hypothetical protein
MIGVVILFKMRVMVGRRSSLALNDVLRWAFRKLNTFSAGLNLGQYFGRSLYCPKCSKVCVCHLTAPAPLME